ncbi:hypothetical protein HAX54_024827 [Datura stramonium]|uniref:Uncharacterized protein n=1 Tax=Datura stramonium TaxID=4076 RepID=A0ABS8S5M1_DATST|nr:hypothetical protein [Datura stramonium]
MEDKNIIKGRKKRKSEDIPDANPKKAKMKVLTLSSTKTQVPKVKLADKITALQQIVSHLERLILHLFYGKQSTMLDSYKSKIQLLSHAYMKSTHARKGIGEDLREKN